MTRTKAADQRFSLKQCFAGGTQSRGLRKPGRGHCYLKFFFSAYYNSARKRGLEDRQRKVDDM